jgi:glycosyltransferase involved in cell wall biosynthesis
LPDARAFTFAVPGDPSAPTGGYAYDRRVARELADAGWRVRALRLPDAFPHPDAQALERAYAMVAATPPDEPVLVDGLALGAMPAIGDALGSRRPLVGLVHHPLALETGLAPDRARALRDSERTALASARRVVTTSRATAAVLASEYGVDPTRIVVAVPGTDPASPARPGPDAGAAPHLLSVGTLVPRKGHDVLLAALSTLADLRWRVTIVGDDGRDPATARALRELAARPPLEGRVAIAGAVDAAVLERLWTGADLFVLASRHEGFGMACAEAVARTLPVVATRAGAIPEAVPDDAGVLVPPDDPAALAAALRTLLERPSVRAALADGARRASPSLVRWPMTAATVASALEAVA